MHFKASLSKNKMSINKNKLKVVEEIIVGSETSCTNVHNFQNEVAKSDIRLYKQLKKN